MKVSAISVGSKSERHRYYYGLLPTFIMEGNAIFQLQVNENKDMASSHSSSQTPCCCFHGPRLRNPDRENSLSKGREGEI